MENLDLVHYIEQARRSGMEDNKIREGLLQAGWPVSSVEEAMMKAPVADIPQPRPKAPMSKFLAVTFTVMAIAFAGYFAGAYYMANFQNFPLWPFEVSVPVPTFTPRPAVTDPTAGWKTYRNEEYGFEFKYPLQQSFIRFVEPNVFAFSAFNVGIHNNLEKYSLKVWFAKNIDINNLLIKSGTVIYSSTNSREVYVLTGTNKIPSEFKKLETAVPLDAYVKLTNSDTIFSFTLIDQPEEQKEVLDQILSTFRFIESVSYELINISDYPFDQKLVKKSGNTEGVLVASVRAVIPELRNDQGYGLIKLSFPENSQKLYFIQILNGSDAPPLGLYSFNVVTNAFTRMNASNYYSWFAPKKLSLNGKLIATMDDPDENTQYQKLFLIDLESDSVKTVATLTGKESFNGCVQDCFGGVFGELTWIDSKTIEYSVYDTTKTEKDQYGATVYTLIAKRRISI